MIGSRMLSNKISGRLSWIITLLVPVVGLVAILDLPFYFTRTSIFIQQYLALFWGLISALIFLTIPAKKGAPREGTPLYDVILSVASICVGLYVTLYYPKILFTLGILDPTRIILGILAVMIVLESTRRLEGWPLVIIILCFIAYALFSNYFPGILQTRGVPGEGW